MREEIQELWQSLEHQIKAINEHPQLPVALGKLYEEVQMKVKKVGFPEEDIIDVTQTIIRYLEFSAQDVETKTIMIEEIVKTEILHEIAQMYKKIFDELEGKTKNREEKLKALSILVKCVNK